MSAPLDAFQHRDEGGTLSERRFTEKPELNPMAVMSLDVNHAAMRENRTLFPSTVVTVTKDEPDRLLVSGRNNRKIGATVEKGKFKGYGIYCLSLEERATCHHLHSFPATCALATLLAAFVLVGSYGKAWPHDALPTASQPLGWTYDYSCCSTNDCREVKTKAIKEDERGFTIVATGELIPHGDKRIHRSKDEFYHWCSVAGLPDSRSLCLYVPDRGL